MNLAQYRPKSMTEGEHVLSVYEARETTAETGTKLVQLFLKTSEGATMIHNFAKTRRGLACLYGFAVACGFTSRDLENIEAEDFIGRAAVCRVKINDHGYCVLKSWRQVTDADDEQSTVERPKPGVDADDILGIERDTNVV